MKRRSNLLKFWYRTIFPKILRYAQNDVETGGQTTIPKIAAHSSNVRNDGGNGKQNARNDGNKMKKDRKDGNKCARKIS